MNEALVIMPTYNELPNLEHSVSQLFAHNANVDLLIVDDNSPDGTGDLANDMAERDSRISVLHRPGKSGLGKAYLAGFDWAIERGYARIIEMDADGSHRAEDLPKLLAVDSADLIIGSRWIAGGEVVNWPASRKFISKAGNLYTRLALGASVRDMTAGFRVYTRELLQNLNLENISSQGYSFQVEMAWRSIQGNARVVEVPIVFVEREFGTSKMNTAIVLEALWLVTKWGFARIIRR